MKAVRQRYGRSQLQNMLCWVLSASYNCFWRCSEYCMLGFVYKWQLLWFLWAFAVWNWSWYRWFQLFQDYLELQSWSCGFMPLLPVVQDWLGLYRTASTYGSLVDFLQQMYMMSLKRDCCGQSMTALAYLFLGATPSRFVQWICVHNLIFSLAMRISFFARHTETFSPMFQQLKLKAVWLVLMRTTKTRTCCKFPYQKEADVHASVPVKFVVVQSACPDLQIPGPWNAMPLLAWRGRWLTRYRHGRRLRW